MVFYANGLPDSAAIGYLDKLVDIFEQALAIVD
jgi:hypothetical protein